MGKCTYCERPSPHDICRDCWMMRTRMRTFLDSEKNRQYVIRLLDGMTVAIPDQTAQCTGTLKMRDDGTVYCPDCGHESPTPGPPKRVRKRKTTSD